MENQEVEKNNFYQYIISKENIYLSIYSLESYVDYKLLSRKDKEMYQKLKDKFNEDYILEKIIPKVQTEIRRLILHEDEYISTKVYFNPKKYEEKADKVEYRPLHTSNLISQIAMVSMMSILIYEFPGNKVKDNKVQDNLKKEEKSVLHLSNLSRLIPSNFYGNRVSLKPKELFKPWQGQYQKYTSLTNEYLKKYHTSLEYKYEVILDLKKFFPSVNPEFLCQYILESLPVVLTEADRRLYTIIIKKLLYCKVANLDPKHSELWKKYYYDDTANKETETKDWDIFDNFTKGIPQGLPQSSFFGNIAMIPIAEKFDAKFPGTSLFYVDDSVIFTNELDENAFEKNLKELNHNINEMVSEELKRKKSILQNPIPELHKLYEIKVHVRDKSHYTRLDQIDKGEVFLMCLSREASHAATDFFHLYSEEEDNSYKERMQILSKQIQKKLNELNDENNNENKEKLNKSSKNPKDVDDEKSLQNDKDDRLKKYIERLTRFYKFFNYRSMLLELRETNDLKKLEDIIYKQDNNLGMREWFVKAYKEDIWAAAVTNYCKQITDEEKTERLKEYILSINENLFEYANCDSSYLYKFYYDLFCNSEAKSIEIKPYDSLKKMAKAKLVHYHQKHYSVVEEYIIDILNKKKKDEIMKIILSEKLYSCMAIVDENTEELFRMVLNTICSNLFSVEIEDKLVMSKRNYRPLRYGELRILMFVRNPLFTEKEFRKSNILLDDYSNRLPIDYSMLEVTDAFQTFVKSPVFVDNLIRTHQYTCDVWRNGSKYLYFYTLHNQEHAVVLIKNTIKLINTFDYFQISALDYYIIFLACYLHDIAMVKIPDFDSFLKEQEEADEITLNFEQSLKDEQGMNDFGDLKRLLVQVYKKMDAFYEQQVRDNHAANSASEIRNAKELEYLDSYLREFVAEVAAAHVYDIADVYFIKSEALSKKISMKFDKIILRLADALDISMNRISRPILYHNLDQMQDESMFHWLSHLLIKGYELKTEYEVNEGKTLYPGSIVEKVIVKIFVEITQLSQCTIKEKCSFAGIDRSTLVTGSNSFDLECGRACSPDGECNFLCKWFTVKNKDLLKELQALTQYLKRIPDNFFGSEITVRIEMVEDTKLSAKQFELIRKHVEG